MIFLFSLLMFLSFLLLLVPAFLIIKIVDYLKKGVSKKKMVIRNKKVHAIIISIVATVLLFYFWFFKLNFYNYKEASVQKEGAINIITIFGKRKLMVHDPISFLERNTFEDSIRIGIPRMHGIINANEVLNIKTGFYYVKGNVTINGNTAEVNLFYVDAYYKNVIASSWNGKYELKQK